MLTDYAQLDLNKALNRELQRPTGYQDARNLRETIAIFKRRRALMSETQGFARCFMTLVGQRLRVDRWYTDPCKL